MRNKALQLSMISILVFLFTAVLRVMLFKYGDYILEINVPCPMSSRLQKTLFKVIFTKVLKITN